MHRIYALYYAHNVLKLFRINKKAVSTSVSNLHFKYFVIFGNKPYAGKRKDLPRGATPRNIYLKCNNVSQSQTNIGNH